ncbi:protein FAM117A isoform X2 [Brachyhypopomus gauderio]|uniref:protein FAM117A isoform X2 n=1 Tax=Brachyhypopomus gauderio TaxID=698409 RepID=UPI0040439485
MSSSRACACMSREASPGPGLQPVRATVPFQFHRTTQADLRTIGQAEKVRVLPQVKIRRAMSSDSIVGPYLQGQWPRDCDKTAQRGHGQKDQYTQTSSWWLDEKQSGVSTSHRRSASWGNAEHLRDIAKLKQLQQKPKPGVYWGILEKPHHPLRACVQSQPVPIPVSPHSSTTQTPSLLHQSEEGLEQELETAFIYQHSRLLEVPDGRRAPVPSLNSRGSSQSEPSSTHLSSSSPSCSCPQCLPELDTDPPGGAVPSCSSPLSLTVACSPRPNKSYCFQREPPEGCERVPACEENTVVCKDQASLASCPDPNKVNFTPHGGSAFCPVSLLKPLLPSVDFLFRSLSVSPGSCWAGQGGSRQTPSPGVL